MNLSITKEFSFEASHVLFQEAQSDEVNRLIYGACNNLHGHTFRLFVTVTGPVDETGMILNYKKLSEIVETRIIKKVDHQHLNYLYGDSLPITSENLIQWFAHAILDELPKDIQLKKLVLYETQKCFCTLEL